MKTAVLKGSGLVTLLLVAAALALIPMLQHGPALQPMGLPQPARVSDMPKSITISGYTVKATSTDGGCHYDIQTPNLTTFVNSENDCDAFDLLAAMAGKGLPGDIIQKFREFLDPWLK